MTTGLLLAIITAASVTASLEVTITGIDMERQGQIIVAVCVPQTPFPCTAQDAIAAQRLSVSNGTGRDSHHLPDQAQTQKHKDGTSKDGTAITSLGHRRGTEGQGHPPLLVLEP